MTNKTYSDMKTNIGNLIQDTSSSMATKIGVWINNKYRDLMSSYNWEELVYTQNLTSTASTSAYALDDVMDNIISVFDRTTEEYLEEKSEQEMYQHYYNDLDTTGTPFIYFLKKDCVKNQPSSSTKPVVSSSSASDTTQEILLRGLSSGGEICESISLSGTTVATASNSYSKIFSISKSASTSGNITIYENDETTVLAVLPPEKNISFYTILNLHYVPSGSKEYRILGKRRVLPLSQDYDYPIIENASDIIELGAIADGWRAKRQFAKARYYDSLYEQKKNELIQNRQASPNKIITMKAVALNRNEGIL